MPKRIQGTGWAMTIGLGLLASSAIPAVAQNATTGNAAATSTAANADSDKAPSGSLEKYHGQLRASELNGANVYNDEGNAIGTINDMLVGDDGKVQSAVISVGGFLGIGTHYVSVPFSQLQVQKSRSLNTGNAATGNGMTGPGATATTGTATAGAMTSSMAAPGSAATGTTTGGATAAGGMARAATGGTVAAGNAPAPQYFSVVLPGATKDSLTKMPEFHYQG